MQIANYKSYQVRGVQDSVSTNESPGLVVVDQSQARKQSTQTAQIITRQNDEMPPTALLDLL